MHHMLPYRSNTMILAVGGPPSVAVPTMGSLHLLDVSGENLASIPHSPDDGTVLRSLDIAGFALFEQGFEVSNLYSLANGPNGDLYIVDSGANSVFHYDISTRALTVLATFPEVENAPGVDPPVSDSVPTKIVYAGGNKFYVAELTGYPFTPGKSRLWQLDTFGNLTELLDGFSTVVDIAIAPDRSGLVVVSIGEWSDDFGNFLPETGTIQKVLPNGKVEPILEGLVLPTSIAFAKGGDLYISSVATGQILMLENR